MTLRETDIQTGLYTPGFFIVLGARELEFAKRDGYPVSLISINLEDYLITDAIEDTEKIIFALKKVGEMIREKAGEGAVTARVSDNEICVLLPGVGIDRARIIGNTIKTAIQEHDREIRQSEGNRPEESAVTLGLASTVDGEVEFSDLLKAARASVDLKTP